MQSLIHPWRALFTRLSSKILRRLMSSSIPGAVNYFMNLAVNVLPSGTTVWFGKAQTVYTAPVTLQVPGITHITHDWAELGSQYKVEEAYRIQCQMITYAGDLNFLQRMNDVFSNLKLLTVALAADYSLGQNVRLCLPVVEGEYMANSDPSGRSMGSLMWYLHCEARIQTLI
jgi:hypothetical protein